MRGERQASRSDGKRRFKKSRCDQSATPDKGLLGARALRALHGGPSGTRCLSQTQFKTDGFRRRCLHRRQWIHVEYRVSEVRGALNWLNGRLPCPVQPPKS